MLTEKSLFKYQKECIQKLKDHDRCLLALDMGLGKTFTSLKLWEEKEKEIQTSKKLIILCQSKKLTDWYHEAKGVFPMKKISIIQTMKQLETSNLQDDIIIMSYQIFTNYTTKNRYWWIKKNLGNCGLIFDESQALKSHKTKISLHMLRFKNYLDWIILLSGDPISTGYKDLYTQMRVLNLFNDKYSWFQFTMDYCLLKPIPGTRVLNVYGYKNIDQLLNKLKQVSIFLKTEDAYDLPDTWIIDERIPCGIEYDEFKEDKVLEFDDIIFDSKGILSEMVSLRELSSGSLIYKLNGDNKMRQFNTFKLDHLAGLLEEFSKEEPVVIFYSFTFERDQIHDRFSNDYKIYEINGGSDWNPNNEERIEPKSLILIQYLAGARGVDGLQHISNRVVYYSPTLSGELYKQSLKRIHRIGQKRKCIYHRFIASPLEQKIYRCLNLFQDYTNEIFKQEANNGEI